MPSQSNYLERAVPDNSGITLTHEKAGANQEPIPVFRPPLHQHRFYEITLVCAAAANSSSVRAACPSSRATC